MNYKRITTMTTNTGNLVSNGIVDHSDQPSLVVENGKITVDTAKVNTLEGNITVRGDVKVYGILDAGLVRTTEVITNQRYEKQYLEFSGGIPESAGTGLLWKGSNTRQFIFKLNPDRFWLTENVDIPADKSFMIEGVPALSQTTLGNQITESNLKKIGTLKTLTVDGDVAFGEFLYFNSGEQKLSLGTDTPNGQFSLYNFSNNSEFVIDANSTGGIKLGTHNPRTLELITDNQTRLSVSETGHITLGQENRDNTFVRVYGKLSVGVKNPTEQFEIAGNMRMGNRLFANSDQPPTSGNYQKGDIIWNSNPKPTAHVGWICTAGGNPGTWNPFGYIES